MTAAVVSAVAAVGAVLAGPAGPAHAQAAQAQPRSVPATFIRDLSLPGVNDGFLRPASLFIDHRHEEIYVCDSGHNRIVIFDLAGTYRYEFHGADLFSTPTDLVVDSEGFIYVVGATREGRKIFRFDFDGRFIREVPGVGPRIDGPFDIGSLAIDDEDRLYVLDRSRAGIEVLDTGGRHLHGFGILEDLEPELLREQSFGSITVHEDRVLIPVPSLGTVKVYSLNGRPQRSFGIKGGNIGMLNFPVKAVVTADGIRLVLDKHRFNIVCFDRDGGFLGEFGGKGISPGWFYHPTLLAVDAENQVYVGQIFENKVQVVELPLFIRARQLQTRGTGSDDAPAEDVGRLQNSETGPVTDSPGSPNAPASPRRGPARITSLGDGDKSFASACADENRLFPSGNNNLAATDIHECLSID
ncbi:MAG: hypothetical protein GF355_14030 [Candidatus Eisenbacteria bacterium]|nr:hypothetical protein [Candidatus Eisenbacteria bacterium]